MVETRYLYIKQGYENRAVFENIYFTDSFFYPAYQQSREMLEEILEETAWYQQENPEHLREASALYDSLLGYPNNVIAFVSHRGQGKTSAMLSFTQALQEKCILQSPELQRKADQFWGETTQGKEQGFQVLPPLDPSKMEPHHSILQLILWQMFRQFEQVCDLENQNFKPVAKEQREKLYTLFQESTSQIAFQKEGKTRKNPSEYLEEMSELGKASQLTGTLHRLVRAFLNYVHPNKKASLVIQIDDADLNAQHAYGITEDLRKYFMIPQVVIFMALDMEQFQMVVEQHFFQDFSVSLSRGGMSTVESCHHLAMENVQKIIPTNRQIYLPSVADALNLGEGALRLIYQRKNTDGTHGHRDNQEENILFHPKGANYDAQLLHFLTERTALEFHPQKGELHPLLPTTMRNLTHFLAYFAKFGKLSNPYQPYLNFLQKRREYEQESRIFSLEVDHNEYIHPEWKEAFDNEKRRFNAVNTGYRELVLEKNIPSLDRWLVQLQRTERYLLSSWASIHLAEQARTFLQQLARTPLSQKHQLVFHFIPQYYVSLLKKEGLDPGKVQAEKEVFLDICRKRGFIQDGHSPNYASIQGILKVLEEKSSESKRFLFGIRFCYTLLLHNLFLENYSKKTTENKLLDFFEGSLFAPSVLASSSQCPDIFAHFSFLPPLFSALYEAEVTERKEEETPATSSDSQLDRALENYSLWQESDGKVRNTLAKRDKTKMQTSLDGIRPFVRVYEEIAGHTYTRKLERENLVQFQENLYFDLMHPLFSLYDQIFSLEETGKRLKQKDEYSLKILLNWEVQQRFLWNLKEKRERSKGDATSLEWWIPNWYYNFAFFPTDLGFGNTLRLQEFKLLLMALVLSSEKESRLYFHSAKEAVAQELILLHPEKQDDYFIKMRDFVWKDRENYLETVVIPLLDHLKTSSLVSKKPGLKKRFDTLSLPSFHIDSESSVLEAKKQLRVYKRYLEELESIFIILQQEIKDGLS